jgi:hypothetical protein
VKLTDLNPKFLQTHGDDATEGMGVQLNCPCGKADEDHRLYVPFSNPIGPGPKTTGMIRGWHRTGDTFETLSTTPSILRMDDCKWHGYITNGEIITV